MKNNIKGLLALAVLFSVIVTGCSPMVKYESNLAVVKSVQAFNNKNDDREINDPNYNEQWYIPKSRVDEAWKLLNSKREVRVAIVDTGVDYNHPDLKNKVLKELGYNFVNNSKEVMDDNWHGTHVAGIIAAEAGNSIGISGASGLANVKIIPIKALDQNGQGSSDIIAKGIKYAADKGADVINFSVGFSVKDAYISEAISYAKSKGAFVVVSSGNDNINSDNTSPSGDEGAYTVASVDGANNKSHFSNYGSSVKIAAPGEVILSTVPGGGYDYRSGTSMAAPLAAAVVAMLKAENPGLTYGEIENILNTTAVDVMEEGKDEGTGYGVLDAYRAVEEAQKIKK
jgi:subtilisin family serine protease